MNTILFCYILVFYTFQIISADIDLEEKEREKSNVHVSMSKWTTKDLFDLELSTIKNIEAIAYPLLDEIRHGAEVARKSGKDPSDCIHVSTKFLLSSVDEFYNELDHCNAQNKQVNNVKNVSTCNEKNVLAFKSVANGAREYFKNCIENLYKLA